MTHFAFRKPKEVEKMVVRKQCKACSRLGVSRALVSMLPAVHNEVFLLRFHCEHCGYAHNDIKRDGFSPVGRRFSLTVRSAAELERVLLHAPSCTVSFPSLEFEFEGGASSAVFHTVASLLDGIAADLREHANVISSDLSAAASRLALTAFLERFLALKEPANMPWRLEFSDPLNLSYIGIDGTLESDAALRFEDFELSFQDFERHHIEDELIDNNTVLAADALSIVPAESDLEPAKVSAAASSASASAADDNPDALPELVDDARIVL
jgi:C4-type Zn-finger protein